MTRRCARCQFAADDLTGHAADAEHWLCVVCSRSLRVDETQTCQRCIGAVRVDLTTIVELYGLLPAELPHHANAQIPGGDALVMLTPGSAGDQAVYGRHHDVSCWCGHSHHVDELPSDPESVAATLASWEDDLRHVFGHPAAQTSTVSETAAYLNAQLHLAASTHPAFDELANDLRRLLLRLQLATATGDWPLRAPVRCFDCGQERLQREYGHAGLVDDWTCRSCQRQYTQESYWLALRAALESQAS